MKFKAFYLFPFLLLFASSCTILKEESHHTASKKNTNPAFLNDITIQNGSNSVRTFTNKALYGSGDTMSLSQEKITIDQLVKTSDTALAGFIKSWLGVPYQYGGTTMQGIDCSAFTKALYAVVYHISLLRTAFEQFSASMPIYDPENLKEGDLVFFKIHSSVISHVGVYLSNGYFVQASTHGVIISNLDDDYWKKYFFAGGRVQG